MNRSTLFLISLMICLASVWSFGSDIFVQLPGDWIALKAVAQAKGSEPVTGILEPGGARLKNVKPDLSYDIAVTLKDGTILQGVNLGWYGLEPPKTDAGDLTDDDKQQMTAILKEVLSFYNKNDILLLDGSHDRATALVQLVRDKAFHSDAGGEIIWHIELWYFKNQHGGWEKVQQANKLLRRDRFADSKSYHEAIDHLRWVPELGGLKLSKGGDLTVVLKK